MAIEIKELVVRLKVNDKHQKSVKHQHGSDIMYDEKKIIDACVDKVLRKIESRKER